MLRSFRIPVAVSVAVLVGLVVTLYFTTHSGNQKPLLVYCAAALKPAVESAAQEFETETGQPIELRFGNSETMLQNAVLSRDGDLFLPADDSFVRMAEERGLVAQTTRLARMHVVVLVRSGNPRGLQTFDDLLRPTLKLGQANPDAAAIGKVTRDQLRTQGKWDAIEANTKVFHTTVTEAANAVQLGGNDAAIVWDAVAANYPELVTVRLSELNGAVGKVEIAVLNTSSNPDAARRFARFLAASDRGMSHLRKAGFTELEPGPAWGQP
jgi:molybdate transport system substrate-binding protein